MEEEDALPQDEDGATPLHMAAALGNTAALEVRAFEAVDRAVLLKTTAMCGQMLCQRCGCGCVRSVDRHGATPLHYAAEHGRGEAVRFLLRQASARRQSQHHAPSLPPSLFLCIMFPLPGVAGCGCGRGQCGGQHPAPSRGPRQPL